MIRFYKKLYVGESVRKQRSRIIRRLRTGRVMPGVYCIAIDDAPNGDMLDICHNALLAQSYYHRVGRLYIMGIAGSHQEAVELVERMLTDALAQTGSCDVRLLCPEAYGA